MAGSPTLTPLALTSSALTAPAVLAFEETRRRWLLRSRAEAALLLLALAALAWLSAGVSGFTADAVLTGLPRIGEYFQRIAPTLEPGALFAGAKTEGSIAYWFYRLDAWLLLLLETAQMALMATVIGAVGAFSCFLAARSTSPSGWVAVTVRRILELMRTVPDIVYALILVWAYGIGPLAGILAMAIHSTGALGKLMSDVVETVERRPIEGIRASGGNWLHAMRFGVLPQVLPAFVSYTLLRFEVNVRSASVIGFVGAGGIGQELYTVISSNYYEEISAIVLLIVLTVVVIDLVSQRLRKALLGTLGERA